MKLNLRRLLLVWMLLAGFVLTAGGLPALSYVPPDYAPAGPGDVYLALGDSIPAGVEATGNADDDPGYPAALLALLQADYPALELQNLAVVSETSTSMLQGQLGQALTVIAQERAAGRRVGLVTLTIGGNDGLSILPSPVGSSADGEQALATFEANFGNILDQLLDALTVDGVRQGDLLIMDYYNPYPGLINPLTGQATADVWIPRFNAAIRAAAEARGIPMAEVATAFAGNEAAYIYVQRPYNFLVPEDELETAFDFHPRPAGQQAIAAAFYAVSGYASEPDPPEEPPEVPPDDPPDDPTTPITTTQVYLPAVNSNAAAAR